MSTSINNAFVKEFESEIHEAYQRVGSRIRPMVRSKNQVKGSSTTFQKIGTGSASTKSRNGAINIMNLSHESVDCNLRDFYAGDWLDALDELKIEHDERQAIVNAGAYALGRKTDELIIESLARSTSISQQKAGGTGSKLDDSTGMSLEKILKGFEIMGNNDVPDDGERYGIVSWRQWSEMLEIEQFANADYVGEDDLPWSGVQAKRWLGTLWVPISGLQKNGDKRTCFWFHKTAVGHASGQDIKSDITWHGDRAAYFINNMMSQGSVMIDSKGVIFFVCKES